jgi:hypothetical protein
MKGVMPGVADARPDIAATIERHQPYQPGAGWLGHLVALSNENKHVGYSPQTRDETRWVEVQGSSGSVGFQPYQKGKGGIVFGGQMFMNGVEVDPKTLQPLGGGRKPYVETIYVDWLFDDPAVSVRTTLESIQSGLVPLVQELLSLAGL